MLVSTCGCTARLLRSSGVCRWAEIRRDVSMRKEAGARSQLQHGYIIQSSKPNRWTADPPRTTVHAHPIYRNRSSHHRRKPVAHPCESSFVSIIRCAYTRIIRRIVISNSRLSPPSFRLSWPSTGKSASEIRMSSTILSWARCCWYSRCDKTCAPSFECVGGGNATLVDLGSRRRHMTVLEGSHYRLLAMQCPASDAPVYSRLTLNTS